MSKGLFISLEGIDGWQDHFNSATGFGGISPC